MLSAEIILVLQTTVALMLTLAVLVVAHEWGHFTAAKLLGVRVEEFAFGFGPKLVRLFTRGDTEYTIHPIPLGGFVKLSGMEPGEGDEDPRGYNAQPIWRRFLIIFAGPFMSFFLAYVIFCSMGMTVGLPEQDARNEVQSINEGSPAAQAGLKPGDRIIAIDGTTITSGSDLQNVVFKSAGKELTFRVQRGSEIFSVKATPELKEIEGQKVGLIGVGLAPTVERVKYGIVGSVKRGTQMTAFFMEQIFKTLTRKSGLKEVGGIVAITRVTAEGVKYGFEGLVFQLAALSLSLAVINLVPWPILDGGHILLLGLEAIRRKKLTLQQTVVFQMVGLATLILLALVLVYVDINRWVPIGNSLQ